MGALELSLDRLASAWGPQHRSELAVSVDFHGPTQTASPASLLRRDARVPPIESIDVMLVSQTGHVTDWTMHPIPSTSAFRRVYRVRGETMADLGALEASCPDTLPRVLVVDTDLIAGAGDALLHRLRHRLGEPEWLLAWDSASPAQGERATRSLCHGGIEWSADADRLAAALDAVLAGELWFPRQFLQNLYLSLIDPDFHTEPAEMATGLTTRETEVLKCMRKGLTNKQIAAQLHISVNTVKKHLAQAFRKSGLRSRRQLRD